MLQAFFLAILNFYSIKNLLKWGSSSISGGFASCVSTFCLYPLSNMQTRLQVVHKETADAKNNFDKLGVKKDHSSYYDVIKNVYETEGIRGFYKGINASLLANFVSFGCYFFWYEFFLILLHDFSNYHSIFTLVSLLAGLVATTFVNPFWVVNARMSISKTKEGFMQTLINALRYEGIHILWKGVLPSYILVINPIIQFTIYENLKIAFVDSNFQVIILFLSGMVSKVAASFVTYPYQVIRTNMHVSKTHIGVLEALQKIYKSRGFLGFYQGHSAKLSQTALNSGIMLLVYEEIKILTKSSLEILFKQPLNT